eukprot:CAMPEP_0196598790 /NCGR_PEP_ID=MMETSP1081-20130531/94510_1 /TAXON_ID=36882 /ORGANISM="Pyramimonas amylifera, Strain CCMP720" /LENGTH=96 /DNA_ID=CAMNT_0041924513 /DNA_START=789 /DNA_END=1079 /DNA_ORIENTATION=-
MLNELREEYVINEHQRKESISNYDYPDEIIDGFSRHAQSQADSRHVEHRNRIMIASDVHNDRCLTENTLLKNLHMHVDDGEELEDEEYMTRLLDSF